MEIKQLLKDIHLHSVARLHNIVIQQQHLDSEALRHQTPRPPKSPLAAASRATDTLACALTHVESLWHAVQLHQTSFPWGSWQGWLGFPGHLCDQRLLAYLFIYKFM